MYTLLYTLPQCTLYLSLHYAFVYTMPQSPLYLSVHYTSVYTTLGIGVHCVSVHSTLVCTMPWCTLCLSLHYASVYTISQCTPCRCTVYSTVQSPLVYTLYILLKQTFCTSFHFYLLYIYNIIYKYMNLCTYIPICFLPLPRLPPPPLTLRPMPCSDA